MEEKRKHPRTEVNEPAFVTSGGSVMHCVVRNISPEGAAIDVENPAFVPQRFRLVMANDSSIVHECRIAWIQKSRIGLTSCSRREPIALTTAWAAVPAPRTTSRPSSIALLRLCRFVDSLSMKRHAVARKKYCEVN